MFVPAYNDDLAPVKILVVENDDWVRYRLQTSLELAGANVHSIRQPAAVGELGESAFDLVLLGAEQYNQQSAEKLEALGKPAKTPKLVLLLGDADHELLFNPIRSAASAFIYKNVRPEQLKCIVQLILQGGTYFPVEAFIEFNKYQSSRSNQESNLNVKNRGMSIGASDEEFSALDKVPGVEMLTTREKEVLGRLLCGEANKEIAKEFGVSPGTIKNYVTNILRAMNMSSRSKLIVHMHSFNISRLSKMGGMREMH